MKILNRLFPREEINGGGLCETYMFRWVLFSTRWFKIYLHHFVGSDWSRDAHNHPKAFISIGLKGSYYEHQYASSRVWDGPAAWVRTTHYRAPWIRRFPASHIHRITATDAWTLVIVGRQSQDWGFFSPVGWRPWREYLAEWGQERKDC